MRTEWNTFNSGVWEREINVRDFIQKNYTPYDGDDTFLEGPTENTTALWAQVMELSAKELEEAKEQRENLIIVAPCDGTVATLDVEEGD